jgi:hypothetical protein
MLSVWVALGLRLGLALGLSLVLRLGLSLGLRLGLSLGLAFALEEDVVGMSVADDRFCVRWGPAPCGVEQPAAATVAAALTARMTQDRDSLIIGGWLPVWTAARTPTNCTGDSGESGFAGNSQCAGLRSLEGEGLRPF